MRDISKTMATFIVMVALYFIIAILGWFFMGNAANVPMLFLGIAVVAIQTIALSKRVGSNIVEEKKKQNLDVPQPPKPIPEQ